MYLVQILVLFLFNTDGRDGQPSFPGADWGITGVQLCGPVQGTMYSNAAYTVSVYRSLQ